MTVNDVLIQLEQFGNAATKSVLQKHGAREPFYGVKVADLKKIIKLTKKNHELSLALYKTGNSDAMYLAGLMADENKITKAQLEEWVKEAYWYYLSEYAVAWVAAETHFGFELGMEWIDRADENTAAAGWSTLAYFASVSADEQLNLEAYKQLLDRITESIHKAPNRVRYTMNGFVIAVASYIEVLTPNAINTAKHIGKIEVNMNGTSCIVPLATTYIQKVIDKNKIGKKRKTARC